MQFSCTCKLTEQNQTNMNNLFNIWICQCCLFVSRNEKNRFLCSALKMNFCFTYEVFPCHFSVWSDPNTYCLTNQFSPNAFSITNEVFSKESWYKTDSLRSNWNTEHLLWHAPENLQVTVRNITKLWRCLYCKKMPHSACFLIHNNTVQSKVSQKII